MSKELTTTSNNECGIEPAIWSALTNSIYPGAKPESIKMAWDYCAAHKLDVLQKLVHIMPNMKVTDAKTGIETKRDVILPGVGLFRVQADRSGKYAGLDAPEYGPLVEASLDEIKVTYPDWCRVTVKKIVAGILCNFTAEEFWIENYANKGWDKQKNRPSKAPNMMWAKRPRGQLAKCAEAQALRKAFPDLLGNQVTAEEMEGKDFIDSEDNSFIKSKDVTPKAASLSERLDAKLSQMTKQESPLNDEEIKPLAASFKVKNTSDEYIKLIDLIFQYDVPPETTEKWKAHFGVSDLQELTKEQILKCIKGIEDKYQNAAEEPVEDRVEEVA